MSKKREPQGQVDRRGFLKMVGVASAASTMPVAASAAAKMEMPADAAGHGPAASAGGSTAVRGYEFFNTEESAFIEAAVDTLIPADSVGPGSKELGVPIYIDRQMAGAYGKGDRLYLDGPFADGTPQQGYQLAMTPSEVIRTGIADLNAHVQKTYRKSFDGLSVGDRVTVLADADAAKIELPTVPITTFFGLLLQLTVEGYFADPMYGGNKDKAAWKMIGFPGADAMYMDKIEPFRGKPYTASPMGIEDLI